VIETYFSKLENLLLQFPNIRSYRVNKRVYNIRQGYIQGSIVFENGYRLDFVEVKQTDKYSKIKYRYQYMTPENQLVFRYDNAPHHSWLSTFPHHKHIGEEAFESNEPSLEDVLLEIARKQRQE